MSIATVIPTRGSGAPAFTAARGLMYIDTDTGDLYLNTSAAATGNTWSQVNGGGSVAPATIDTLGGGYVDTFSVRNGTPIFPILDPGYMFAVHKFWSGTISSSFSNCATSWQRTTFGAGSGVSSGDNANGTSALMTCGNATNDYALITNASAPGGNSLQTRHELYLAAYFETGANITNVRYWHAISDNTGPDMIISDNGAAFASYLGLRFSAGVDTNWMLISANAGTLSTPVDTGVLVEADTAYLLEIGSEAGGGQVWGRVNKAGIVFNASNLPSSTLVLQGWFGMGLATKEDATKQMRVSGMKFRQR